MSAGGNAATSGDAVPSSMPPPSAFPPPTAATATAPPPSIVLASRTGSVTVEVEAVPSPRVVRGEARIDADGTVHLGATTSVTLVCPPGTDVAIGTSTGAVHCRGALGVVSINTRTGSITVEQASEVDVRTRTGKVKVGQVAGDCTAVSGTSGIHVGSAARLSATTRTGTITARSQGSAKVRSATGNVRLEVGSPADVDVETGTGAVEVRLADGPTPERDLASRSGRIRDVRQPAAGGGRVRVRTRSGSITVG